MGWGGGAGGGVKKAESYLEIILVKTFMYLFLSRRWGCREGGALSEVTMFLTMNEWYTQNMAFTNGKYILFKYIWELYEQKKAS